MSDDPYTDADGEVRELDDEFFAQARRGRPSTLPGKQRVEMSLLIDQDLACELDKLDDRDTFVNEAIRKALAGG